MVPPRSLDAAASLLGQSRLTWGPDRCPECGAWRVSMQQQVEEKHDFIKDSPFEFDSELD